MSWTITPQTKVPVDPYCSQVSLLLHGDGANGSTTITDSSPTPKTVTAVGNAQISTVQSKFGGSSIAFDGSGDRLTIPQNTDFSFGTGDLTVEFWAYKSANGLNGYDAVFTSYRTASAPGFFVELSASRGFAVYARSGLSDLLCTATTTINDSSWHHWAACRSGATWYLFKDGIALSKGTDNIGSTAITTTAFGHLVGSAQDTSFFDFNGYIDDLRITKGVARYTANFTPPTAPFPDA